MISVCSVMISDAVSFSVCDQSSYKVLIQAVISLCSNLSKCNKVSLLKMTVNVGCDFIKGAMYYMLLSDYVAIVLL